VPIPTAAVILNNKALVLLAAERAALRRKREAVPLLKERYDIGAPCLFYGLFVK
jgi:hypothetical protein